MLDFVFIVDTLSQEMDESDDGTKYWVPRVDVEMIPKVGDFFATAELAEVFYKKYAQMGGFDVRLSNKKYNRKGVLTNRYYVCSKEGIPAT